LGRELTISEAPAIRQPLESQNDVEPIIVPLRRHPLAHRQGRQNRGDQSLVFPGDEHDARKAQKLGDERPPA